jgi:hypothetical protein
MFAVPLRLRRRSPFRHGCTAARRRPRVRSGNVRHGLILLVVAFTALGGLFMAGFGGATSVAAATPAAVAPAATQCDPPAFPTGAGFEVSCTITIHNTVTSTGGTTSSITATGCLAVAGVLPPFGCTTVVTTSNQLVSTVNQCNGVVDGGGSNVVCSVSVINTIPAATNSVGVTVNQCIGSGTGGGTQPTTVCAPVASTTGATVTQCNGSATGGGGSTRVKCNETGGATALPITINQCNGSANGGGSTVTCSTTFTNNFVAAPTTPTTATPTSSAPGGGGGTTPTTVTAPGTGSGVTGKTGTAKGVGGSTQGSSLGTLGFVPTGAPQTGFGGAARGKSHELVLVGSGLLLAGGLALVLFLRRRRIHVRPISVDDR